MRQIFLLSNNSKDKIMAMIMINDHHLGGMVHPPIYPPTYLVSKLPTTSSHSSISLASALLTTYDIFHVVDEEDDEIDEDDDDTCCF